MGGIAKEGGHSAYKKNEMESAKYQRKTMRAGMVGFLEQIARVSETATCVIFNTATIERTSFARYPFIYGTFVPTDVMTGLRHFFTGSGQTGYPANR